MTKILAFVCAGTAAVLAQSAPPLPPLPADIPADARFYTKLTTGRTGRLVAWRDPDGTLQSIYQHRNRDGCQTNIRSVITIDAVGVPIRLQHTGQTCQPSRAVNETYARSGSVGIWRSPTGDGQGDTAGKKFYVSVTSVPEERALLVRALLASGDRLALLPEGDAHLERVAELTLRSGDRSETVTHYRIHGVEPQPVSVWIDRRGELFALEADLIRQGWEASAARLRREPNRIAVWPLTSPAGAAAAHGPRFARRGTLELLTDDSI